jgi:uncharacterized phage protein gp47/JayE
LAYFQPYIDATGLHIPLYTDIRDFLISQCLSIFGQDLYLGKDTQDYQWISVVSEKIYDAFLLAQNVYNNRGPGTAVGSGLDGIVKINGIKRSSATYSTCHANVAGVPGAIITNAIALDQGNIKWDLPTSIIIPSNGIATNLLLTCEQPGPISAAPGTIIQMFNPQYGWTGITNTDNATLGSYVENDGQLRSRQQTSTAQPSKTVLEGIKGAIAAITGVTRYQVYENDTNNTDSNGLPAHSITAVVEGGSDQDIAQALYVKKTPGCYTNGTTSVQILDSNGNPIYNALGKPEIRNFYRPSYVDIDIVINLKMLSGYTSATTTQIQNSIVAFLNSFSIGSELPISSLWGTVLAVNTSLTNPTFSVTGVTAAVHGGTQGTTDIPIAFNQILRGNSAYITINIS